MSRITRILSPPEAVNLDIHDLSRTIRFNGSPVILGDDDQFKRIAKIYVQELVLQEEYSGIEKERLSISEELRMLSQVSCEQRTPEEERRYLKLRVSLVKIFSELNRIDSRRHFFTMQRLKDTFAITMSAEFVEST